MSLTLGYTGKFRWTPDTEKQFTLRFTIEVVDQKQSLWQWSYKHQSWFVREKWANIRWRSTKMGSLGFCREDITDLWCIWYQTVTVKYWLQDIEIYRNIEQIGHVWHVAIWVPTCEHEWTWMNIECQWTLSFCGITLFFGVPLFC
jgi:hypothetical protein